MPRRFRKPWTVHEGPESFWVEDADGKRFGYCGFRDDLVDVPGFNYLTRDEARRLANNIAKLPDLLAARR